MYPIHMGFEGVLARIEDLSKKGYDAEAFVTSVFTLEKLIRRCLLVMMVQSGFTSKKSQCCLKSAKYRDDWKKLWFCLNERGARLSEARNWQYVNKCFAMRNMLVHGGRIYKMEIYKEHKNIVVQLISEIHSTIVSDCKRDPWTRLPVRIKSNIDSAVMSRLHRLPEKLVKPLLT